MEKEQNRKTRIISKFSKFLADILTRFPYSRKLSLFVDRLLKVTEKAP